jgi:hypothetical protein
MSKIIKPGIANSREVVLRGTCLGCGAIVDFEECETHWTDNVDPSYRYGVCPTEGCDFYIQVDAVSIPRETKSIVQESIDDVVLQRVMMLAERCWSTGDKSGRLFLCSRSHPRLLVVSPRVTCSVSRVWSCKFHPVNPSLHALDFPYEATEVSSKDYQRIIAGELALPDGWEIVQEITRESVQN